MSTELKARDDTGCDTGMYRELLDDTENIILVRECHTGDILYANRKAAELMERERGQMESPDSSGHTDERPCGPDELNRLAERGTDSVYVYKGRCYLIHASRLNWCGREAFAEYATDITEQKKVENSLRLEHEKIRFALDSANIFVWEYDPVHHVITQRAEVARIFNTPPVMENMPYAPVEMGIVHPDSAADFIEFYRRIDNGNIMALLYTFDIDRDKRNEAVITKVISTDYDCIMLVDLRNNTFSKFTGGKEAVVPTQSSRDYVETMRRGNSEVLVPQDVERAIHDMMPEVMEKNLEESPFFSTVYQEMEKDGAIRYKRMTYSWLDKALGQVIMTGADITEVMENEQQRQEVLRSALLQAEHASTAKTDFLSKMSHEIRTPMNAIIGMNALAAQNLHDPEQAADCIAKVGISARFLLSLINDILDMSRIESGRMDLRSEEIPFEEFLNGINNMIYGQANECGISYDSIVTGFVAENYVGDAMKLQQVLVNLLSNAVKFTPKGGKVQLIVSQERTERGRAIMRFTVNDTGCGISEEFQKVMFEPFEQERGGNTSPYGGTGLGLAITKNLVRMMGGSIAVNSIVGVGSDFVVTLPLGIAEEKVCRKIGGGLHLEKMSALVVDDEILICQQTEALLLDIGMKAEWVDSGRKAVDLVRARWSDKKCFDIILIDWKMPEMDGIETARQIRAIVGPDVTIIIITAYEWAEIEREARAAGVNLLVSKPIFKTSLISTFERIYTDKKRASAPPKPVEYSFTGKRALRVEDHLLNVEVAKRLLLAKGMEVTVAENGLAAIETFTSNPDNFFDIILMDIRMPVMDGLTAARSIRLLKKAAAKTVPIVAMSANAFDDDIEKSYSAGMNAHLSKPIEPELLYETIARFLKDSEEW